MRVLSRDVNTYSLENLISHKTELTHVTDMRTFLYDPKLVDPAAVARKDIIGETLIERILEHYGDVKKRSTLDFKVRWEGIPESLDNWLEYKDLRDTNSLHINFQAQHAIMA